ncbi:Orotate phosphoribosyltransferase [Bienertia sinuspersici]
MEVDGNNVIEAEERKKLKPSIFPMETDDLFDVMKGFANPDTIRSLHDWCWRDRPSIVFLMETMINEKRLEKLKKCGYNEGSYSTHHVEANVLDENNNIAWNAVGIYGWPKIMNKHLTWDPMRRMVAGIDVPILLFGDFNEILHPSEKQGGVSRMLKKMEDFGNFFTWQRGNSSSRIVRERLDRLLASMSWCALFPSAVVLNLNIQNLDHGPILLKIVKRDGRNVRGRILKFESLWLSNESCKQLFSFNNPSMIEEVLRGDNSCITRGMNDKLDAKPTNEEIK